MATSNNSDAETVLREYFVAIGTVIASCEEDLKKKRQAYADRDRSGDTTSCVRDEEYLFSQMHDAQSRRDTHVTDRGILLAIAEGRNVDLS